MVRLKKRNLDRFLLLPRRILQPDCISPQPNVIIRRRQQYRRRQKAGFAKDDGVARMLALFMRGWLARNMLGADFGKRPVRQSIRLIQRSDGCRNNRLMSKAQRQHQRGA